MEVVSMTQYRSFYLDNFRLTGATSFEAGDDCGAILAALRSAGGRAFELWREGVRLRSFPAADSQNLEPAVSKVLQGDRQHALVGASS
jgi:hypothetical protein